MKSFLSVLYLLAVALVAAAPISPLDDSFYHEPAGLERHEVGAILKSRVVYDNPLASDFFPMNVKNTYQLMIRSLDAQDRPCTVVTTVVEPFNGNSSRVLSYLFAQDRQLVDCAANTFQRYGAPTIDNTIIESQMAFVGVSFFRSQFASFTNNHSWPSNKAGGSISRTTTRRMRPLWRLAKRATMLFSRLRGCWTPTRSPVSTRRRTLYYRAPASVALLPGGQRLCSQSTPPS